MERGTSIAGILPLKYNKNNMAEQYLTVEGNAVFSTKNMKYLLFRR